MVFPVKGGVITPILTLSAVCWGWGVLSDEDGVFVVAGVCCLCVCLGFLCV